MLNPMPRSARADFHIILRAAAQRFRDDLRVRITAIASATMLLDRRAIVVAPYPIGRSGARALKNFLIRDAVAVLMLSTTRRAYRQQEPNRRAPGPRR